SGENLRPLPWKKKAQRARQTWRRRGVGIVSCPSERGGLIPANPPQCPERSSPSSTERIRHSVIVATGKVTSNKHLIKDSVTVEKARNPLPFLKLFETAEVGVEVTAQKGGGVSVKRVREASPFGRAGVRAGDQITAVGETTVKSPEQFRRLLRAKV